MVPCIHPIQVIPIYFSQKKNIYNKNCVLVWGLDLNQIGITGICGIEYVYKYRKKTVIQYSEKGLTWVFISFLYLIGIFGENSLSFYVFLFSAFSSLIFGRRDCVALINVRSRRWDGRELVLLGRMVSVGNFEVLLVCLIKFTGFIGFLSYLEFTTHSKLNSQSYKHL